MIRLLSLFSGIGAFETALRRGGYQFETVNYCEIDPYASKAYSQIHGISEDYNLHDVRQVNTLLMDNVNLMTWGWPCQDISVAGKQRGFTDSDGNRTRSGLFFEGLRILETLQPEYAIAENVKALTGKKFTAEFETVLTSLDKAGYNNYWKVLNAKDYGIPQNRERVFIVSIRKDIDNGTFTFPEGRPLTLRVKDLLEPVVDEKYYINNERAESLIRQILAKTDTNLQETDIKVNNIGTYNNHQSGIVNDSNGLSRCLTAVDYKDLVKIIETKTMIEITEPKIKRLGNLYDENAGGSHAGNVYDPNELAPTTRTAQGGGLQPHILVNPDVCGNDVVCRTIKSQYYKTSTANFERTGTHGATGVLDITNYRIRKLTPRECFRLMGFTDEEFNRIKGVSNTQLYKMAGNSIVVNVLEGIFNNLLRK